MSTRTMLLRAMMQTKPRHMAALARQTGLGEARLYHILANHNGQGRVGLRLDTLRKVAEGTGIEIGQLAEWWAEDEANVPDEVLQYSPSWHRRYAERRTPVSYRQKETRV